MIPDVLVAYAPFWYLAAVIALVIGASAVSCRWNRRVARARRSLSELEARAAVRPSPASIDVEPMR